MNMGMSYQISPAIRSRIEAAALSGGGMAALSAACRSISARYRRESADLSGSLQMKGELEALAYLATRLPATYAVNRFVMAQVSDQVPDFEPVSVLDAGAGPGTASLAAAYSFDGLRHITLVEPNRYLRAVADQCILLEIDTQYIWVESPLERCSSFDSADLVLASYVFNEIPADQREKIFKVLWAACTGVLVVIETGTPLGFEVTRQFRQIAAGMDDAVLIGPCPQAGPCPLSTLPDRWCHFSVRVERTRLHKDLKDGATLGYEDEKFSWVAFARPHVRRQALPDYRVIGYPSGGKVVSLQVCSGEGRAETLTLPKSSPLYKRARKVVWGDSLTVTEKGENNDA